MIGEPPGIETCPICACIVTDSADLPPNQKVVLRKVKTVKLGSVKFLCHKCCPDDDTQERMSRLMAIAHRDGVEQERQSVAAFLSRYLPRPHTPLSEMRF